mgnify:CR=1 FL=1
MDAERTRTYSWTAPSALREAAMARHLLMDAYPMRVLVVGGSQGAAAIMQPKSPTGGTDGIQQVEP